ncbi:hypothetical protein KGM_210086 [Danaus plexippus plexippus]|uniref:Uncharacterized protein n=1 Tax=Danaus plexippus plexippus TaxID=278856 RepID=A0A212EVW9_DANPL|nr:hypothetical protein KGM_210086 [Danaus plexippus plexippus]
MPRRNWKQSARSFLIIYEYFGFETSGDPPFVLPLTCASSDKNGLVQYLPRDVCDDVKIIRKNIKSYLFWSLPIRGVPPPTIPDSPLLAAVKAVESRHRRMSDVKISRVFYSRCREFVETVFIGVICIREVKLDLLPE